MRVPGPRFIPNSGSLYFRDGNLIIALEEVTLAAAIDPDYAPAFSTRGLILYHVKEYDSAGKDFRRALSLEPRNSDINNNFGWFLCHTGREKGINRVLRSGARQSVVPDA